MIWTKNKRVKKQKEGKIKSGINEIANQKNRIKK